CRWISFGRRLSPSRATPSATAPEDTSTTWMPWRCSVTSCFTHAEIASVSRPSPLLVIKELPIFTTQQRVLRDFLDICCRPSPVSRGLLVAINNLRHHQSRRTLPHRPAADAAPCCARCSCESRRPSRGRAGPGLPDNRGHPAGATRALPQRP